MIKITYLRTIENDIVVHGRFMIERESPIPGIASEVYATREDLISLREQIDEILK